MSRRLVISSRRGFQPAHTLFLLEEAQKLSRPLMDQEAITLLCLLLMAYDTAINFPTPKNLNYWWTFGGILSMMLVFQIVTGIV